MHATDIEADVVKLGMLPSAEVVDIVATKLEQYGRPNLVVDPVMVSTSGHKLATSSATDAIIQKLLPLATVICPNIKEAEVITGHRIQSVAEMEMAAKEIYAMGPQTVLIKGGHLDSEMVKDVVYDGHQIQILQHRRIHTDRLHGTGCTLASAIAAGIAQGKIPQHAIQQAIRFVEGALASSVEMDIGQGTQLPFHHGFRWSTWPPRPSFCGKVDFSLYAITDVDCNEKHGRSFTHAIREAIAGGVSVLQIREKERNSRFFLECVQTAVEYSDSVPVIVNDRVDIALAADADGVHLGQVNSTQFATAKFFA